MLKAFHYKTKIEAGVDEAGRGCYAGPVVAAAVILPRDFHHPLLNDSKLLSEKERNILRPVIEKESISYGVGFVDHEEIDKINILQASFRAMHLALDRLSKRPDMLLIDGNRFKPYTDIKHICVIKGDSIYASIAAASVLAKTYRDEYMLKLHEEIPHYDWQNNKGYGTAAHRAAIEAIGLSKYHRKSFKILDTQPELFKANELLENP